MILSKETVVCLFTAQLRLKLTPEARSGSSADAIGHARCFKPGVGYCWIQTLDVATLTYSLTMSTPLHSSAETVAIFGT